MSVANERKRSEIRAEKRRRAEYFAAAIWAVIWTFVPLGFAMKVQWACVLWAFAWIGVLVFIFTVSRTTSELGLPTKVIASFGLTGLLLAGLYSPIHDMWRKEQALALSGYLVAERLVRRPDMPSNSQGLPSIQFGVHGTNGTTFIWGGPTNKSMIQFLQDAGLKIELDETGHALVSTPVRDREGQIIAEITKNHWRVSTGPIVWDKNYTSDSLEVKDRRGHIVLQLRVLPDRTQIAGEWRDEFGRGVRISQGKEGDTVMYFWKNPQEELAGTVELAPLFKYPSSEHWAEWSEGR